MSDRDFIKSVESLIPNPPFLISIHSASAKKTIDEKSFSSIKADSLKNYSWSKNDNIKHFHVEFGDENSGIVGSAVIAVLEKKGIPVSELEMTSKSIQIEGQTYDLEKSLQLGSGRINFEWTSIEIDDDGDVTSSTSQSMLAQSISKFSFHGIEVSTSLFPDPWIMKKNQARLDWPIPVLLVVDVRGGRDLDLNSARTQVILGDKWTQLEEDLTFAIFSRAATMMKGDYWNTLKALLLKYGKSPAAFVNVVVASPQAPHCNASGRILSGFNQT